MSRVLSATLLLLWSAAAWADGKFYSSTIALSANVTIPDQRALIHYSNGVERLVIETRFTGDGSNFAWVIPLPSEPVIEAASAGVFPTLESLFQPQIKDRVKRHFLVILGVVLFAFLLRQAAKRSWLDVAIFLLVSSFIAVLLLPALSTGKARTSSAAGVAADAVQVLERKLVGVFVTTTLTARDPDALADWLRGNGFRLSTNSQPVIESYVKDGWVFVAAKVHRETTGVETSAAHPLSFTFKTGKPVYPMRLTGVDNGPLQVELYVFGPSRAGARRFKTVRCTLPEYPQLDNRDEYLWYRVRGTKLTIVHPTLRQWLGGTPVATKLTAKLSPAEMKEDVWLEWSSFVEQENRVYSPEAAWIKAANWGAGVFAGALLLGLIVTRKTPDQDTWLSPALGALLAAIAVSVLTWWMLPKTQVIKVRRADYFVKPQENLLKLDTILEAVNRPRSPLNLRELQAKTQELITRTETNTPARAYWKNHYLGGQIREEDSPGNYTLRVEKGQIVLSGYDALGAERVFHEWPVPKPDPTGGP